MNEWLEILFGLSKQTITEDTFNEPAASVILKKQNIKKLKNIFLQNQTNWNHRYFYCMAMSRHFSVKKLKQWVKMEPESADAHLMYGARMLKKAWSARGYGRGFEVNSRRWKNFYALLEQTEDSLMKAAELHPDDPTPWVYLIMVAVYSSEERVLIEDYYYQAINRDSDNWHAHMNMFTGLTKKYGGSHDEMFNFVRNVRENVADDSLLNCLVLKAHSECWKYINNFDEDHEEAKLYLNNENVIEECLDAYNKSLAHIDHVSPDNLMARINCAGTLCLFRQKEPLKRELDILGDRLQDIHWRWVGIEGYLDVAKYFVTHDV